MSATPFNPFDVSDNSVDDSSSNSFDSVAFGESVITQPTPVIDPPSINGNNQDQPKEYQKKHNIVDMYWFINSKLFKQEKLDQNEVQLLTIGYNADFANLRIGFFEADQKAFTETSILKHEAKTITSINVFSEAAYQILNSIYKTPDQAAKIYNFERIFSASSINKDWKPNQTIFELVPSSGSIIIRTKLSDGSIYCYHFTGWQLQAFISALKFMTSGQSWQTTLLVK